MDIVQAARNTETVWHKRVEERSPSAGLPDPNRAEDGHYLAHQRWLLHEIIIGNITGEKAHRWLGYAQGFLVADESITLDDCKYANMLA